MTHYLGGKKRIGKEISLIIHRISSFIENETDFVIKGYCEPFCGMMGIYTYIPELFENHKPKLKYKAGDRNPYIIKLWNGLKKGFNPPTKCTKDEYYEMKHNKDNSLKGIFLGFASSLRGVFRSTFVKKNIEKQAYDSKNIGKNIKDVELKTGDYKIFSDLKNYIIYCDPPYKNSISPYSIGDKYNTKFDYKDFINWCKEMSKYNIIFISEYSKPTNDSILVWNKGKEKLYLIFN